MYKSFRMYTALSATLYAVVRYEHSSIYKFLVSSIVWSIVRGACLNTCNIASVMIIMSHVTANTHKNETYFSASTHKTDTTHMSLIRATLPIANIVF